MAKKSHKRKTKNIGVSVSSKIANELEQRAKSIDLSTSAYCKVILSEWIKSGKKLHLDEE
tara:strand:- start:2230 stop:2409 length:180 start_codon:yes stop_codon:yes gene_type:complete